jgi:hypothetical protein
MRENWQARRDYSTVKQVLVDAPYPGSVPVKAGKTLNP